MELHFLRPYALLTAFFALLIGWFLFRYYYCEHAWRYVCDPHLLPHLLVKSNKKKQSVAYYLLGMGWLLCVLALSGPSMMHTPNAIYRTSFSRVIVLDLSPSMNAHDLLPNRWTRAKYKVMDLLKKQMTGQVGLIVFSGEAYVVSPLTQDAATITAMVPVLDPEIMPVSGEAMNDALKKAQMLFDNAGVKQGNIILVTDSPVNAADLQTVNRLKERGITTSVLAMGANASNNLRELADKGGGYYAPFTQTQQDVDSLWAASDDPLNSPQKTEQSSMIWHDQGRYLLFPLLVLAGFAFRRGWMEWLGS